MELEENCQVKSIYGKDYQANSFQGLLMNFGGRCHWMRVPWFATAQSVLNRLHNALSCRDQLQHNHQAVFQEHLLLVP